MPPARAPSPGAFEAFGIVAGLVCSMTTASCSRTPVGPRASRPQPSGLATAAPRSLGSSLPTSAPSASVGAEPWFGWQGCAPRLDPSSGALELLTAFAGECVHGMVPFGAHPERSRLSSGQALVQTFELADAQHCVRAAAACDTGVKLVLLIEEESGKVILRSAIGPRLISLGAEGPLCLDQPGRYRARATVTQGSGWVALRVWQAE
jgi:hypothetical protein